MATRARLDSELVRQGLARSRRHAGELITAGRKLRADSGIAPGKLKHFIISTLLDADQAARLTRDKPSLEKLLQAENVQIVVGVEQQGMPAAVTILGTIYLPLPTVDLAAEMARLQAELAKTRGFLTGIESKLANAGFRRGPAAREGR